MDFPTAFQMINTLHILTKQQPREQIIILKTHKTDKQIIRITNSSLLKLRKNQDMLLYLAHPKTHRVLKQRSKQRIQEQKDRKEDKIVKQKSNQRNNRKTFKRKELNHKSLFQNQNLTLHQGEKLKKLKKPPRNQFKRRSIKSENQLRRLSKRIR